MEIYAEIRRRVLAGELSLRQACLEYRLNFRTVDKIVHHPQPPSYQQTQERPKPVLGPFLPIVLQILQDDRQAPPKQRHSARRIFERLRDEHDYPGCPSIVRAAVAQWKQSQAEVFVPLVHPPGEAQADFGRAEVVVQGVSQQAALFVLTLPHSNGRFGCLFPRECTETFHEGHARAFAFFGGVPRTIRYDNTRIAVIKLLGAHQRHLTREFLRLQAHFAFATQFCGARQAQQKGHVENGVGYVRRNYLVPVPQADSWEAHNERLTTVCQRELEGGSCREGPGKAAALAADQAAFLPMPAEPFEARRVELVTINSLSLGRFDTNDYSVPTRFAYQTLTATGTIDWVRFSHRGTVVAVHPRNWARRQVTFDPLHYLALLERKPFAFDSAKPLQGWQLPDCFATLRKRLEQADAKAGTRQYIRVLRLLENHDLAVVTQAVTRALRLAVTDPDGVRLLVEQSRECPKAGFDLAGRPSLQAVRLPAPDLSLYSYLTSSKEVKR